MESTVQSLCESYGIRWHEEPDAMALADELSTFVSQSLAKRVAESGRASLVVSGGSTPAPVFERLAQADIDWSKVSVTLADERWVPPGHADSNESLVRDTLMVSKAAHATFVPLYRDGLRPEQAVSAIAQDIAGMPRPFTVTILGMGGDGHTASLFPDAPPEQLRDAMALDNSNVAAVLHPPSVSQVRISLTRAALLASEHRILHITGDSKRQVLADALAEAQSVDNAQGNYAPPLKPIVGLITTQPDAASVYWSR